METVSTVVPAEFAGGWVTFDLDMDLLNDEKYIFTCYLQDGQDNEYYSTVLGRNDDPWPGVNGYSASVDAAPFDMEDWSEFMANTWDYNFRLGGNYITDPDRRTVTLPVNTTGTDMHFVSGTDTIAIVNFASETLDSLRIVAFPDMIPPFIPGGTDWVRRYFDITPYPASASFEADMTLFYDQAEFDASGLADESLLHLYRFDDSAFEWQPLLGVLDETENSVFVAGCYGILDMGIHRLSKHHRRGGPVTVREPSFPELSEPLQPDHPDTVQPERELSCKAGSI